MRELLKFIAAVVLLMIVAIIVTPMVIDPNDYREQIQSAVKEKTGRDLSINGDLSLSLFPWVGVEINDVSLSNATGFKAEHFAAIEQANVKVKLLPLFSEQVEVSTVVLKGLRLNLAKNKTGQTNWEDMAQSASESAEPAKQPVSKEQSASSGAALAAIAIGGLQIVDANVTWNDASKNERYDLLDLDLTTGTLSLGNPMGVDLAFTVDSSKPKATVRIKLNGDLVINSALNKFDFQGLKLAIDAAGDPVPSGAIRVDIASHLIADLSGAGSLTLNPLSIKFDESTLTGNVSVNDFAKPAIAFDLAVDTINVDRYMPKAAAAAGNTGSKKAGIGKTGAAPTPAAVALIPVETIRGLNIDGAFNVQSLVVNGLKADAVSLKLLAKNGVLKTEQAVKKFYNGSYAGKTTIDARQKTPRITVKEQANGIDIEPLLIDLTGESAISGVANIDANLITRGNTVPAFKSALNGTVSFSFQDGAITGVDAGALMNQAQAILKGDVTAALVEGDGKTPFSDVSGSAKIINGLVKNNDLLVATPVINIKGAGTADLVSEKLNYGLTLQRTKATTGAELADSKDVKNTLIPVIVRGVFAEPKIRVDVRALVIGMQRERIEEKKAKLIQKIDEKLDGKLKERAGDLLKGLF